MSNKKSKLTCKRRVKGEMKKMEKGYITEKDGKEVKVPPPTWFKKVELVDDEITHVRVTFQFEDGLSKFLKYKNTKVTLTVDFKLPDHYPSQRPTAVKFHGTIPYHLNVVQDDGAYKTKLLEEDYYKNNVVMFQSFIDEFIEMWDKANTKCGELDIYDTYFEGKKFKEGEEKKGPPTALEYLIMRASSVDLQTPEDWDKCVEYFKKVYGSEWC